MKRTLFPEVVQVAARPGHRLLVFFNDGMEGEIEALPLLKGEVFKPLLDEQTFRSTLTVLNHTVAWDLAGKRDETQCIDLDPIELHRLAISSRERAKA